VIVDVVEMAGEADRAPHAMETDSVTIASAQGMAGRGEFANG